MLSYVHTPRACPRISKPPPTLRFCSYICLDGQVLMSALKTKSELYESVRQIMQEDFAQSLLASSSISSTPSHRPVATHISQEQLGRYVSAHKQDSEKDTSRNKHSRAPSDSDRHVDQSSSKIPLRRTTPSGALSAADSMR